MARDTIKERKEEGREGRRKGNREEGKKESKAHIKRDVSGEKRDFETKLWSPQVFIYIWAFCEMGVKNIFDGDWGESRDRTKWTENWIDKFILEINYPGGSGEMSRFNQQMVHNDYTWDLSSKPLPVTVEDVFGGRKNVS